MTRFATKTISTLAGLGALVLLAVPAAAHGGGQGGYGGGYGGMMMGPGMMAGPGMMGGGPGFGQGYGQMMGPGMMGPGAGYGMMGPGHGPGFGGGFGPCGQQQGAAAAEDIDADAVRARLERWLAVQGNDRLKLGKIEEVDDDVITAEIVTVDDSLVRKLTIDRHTGWMRPAK